MKLDILGHFGGNTWNKVHVEPGSRGHKEHEDDAAKIRKTMQSSRCCRHLFFQHFGINGHQHEIKEGKQHDLIAGHGTEIECGKPNNGGK